jgi:hypothetical protein
MAIHFSFYRGRFGRLSRIHDTDILVLVEVDVSRIICRSVLFIHKEDSALADALTEARNPEAVLVIQVGDALKVPCHELLKARRLIVTIPLHALKRVLINQILADIHCSFFARDK